MHFARVSQREADDDPAAVLGVFHRIADQVACHPADLARVDIGKDKIIGNVALQSDPFGHGRGMAPVDRFLEQEGKIVTFEIGTDLPDAGQLHETIGKAEGELRLRADAAGERGVIGPQFRSQRHDRDLR